MNEKWKIILKEEGKKPYFNLLMQTLKDEIGEGKIIFPPANMWYRALSLDPDKIKVVILGQDPYHNDGQAHGLSFSVPKGIKIPPSLKNIFTEIEQEFDVKMAKNNGDLTPWLEQGVMLLNSILTVEKNLPASHHNLGWERFTDEIISTISSKMNNIVFMLWGSYAQKKNSLIDSNKHLILTSSHPSPFSAYKGFLGNNHFKLANDYLSKNGKQEIDWKITD